MGVDHPWWKDFVWQEIRKWPWFPLPDPPPFDFDMELPMFPPWQQHNVISMIVRIERGKVAEVMHVARTRMHAELERTSATPFTAQLHGKEGQVLAEAPLLRLDTAACGCGCGSGGSGEKSTSYLAQALIPDVAPGESLAIGDGKDVVWERKAPAKPAGIEEFVAKLDRKGALQLQWSASREAAEFWLRWSTDGEHWQSLATALTDHKARFEAHQLPAGKVMLQVVAHDGFHSTASKPFAITLPERAPEVAILHPVDGHTYSAGQTLRLWGSVGSADGRSAPPKRCVWLLGRKEIGQEPDTWSTLEPGQHKLTLRVEDKGGTSESTVTINVVRHGEAD